MVPRASHPGRSFKGAAAYYLHDKDARTSNRVAFTHTENLPTDNPHMAWRWMAYTAKNAKQLKQQAGIARTGRPPSKSVLTFSLSWHPEQEPEAEHMIDTMKSALEKLGLSNHQVLMVAHSDEDHAHIHAIVNLVDPENGRTASLPYSKRKLSKWAEDYERRHGKIYCRRRVENNARRERGEKIRYKDPELDLKVEITKLYRSSDSGRAFRASVEQMGYKLAQGKRIVLIDREGKQHSLFRQVEGAKAKEIRAKLADVVLPAVDEARGRGNPAGGRSQKPGRGDDKRQAGAQRKAVQSPAPAKTAEPEYYDRDEQERQWQDRIVAGSLKNDRIKRTAAALEKRRQFLADRMDRQAEAKDELTRRLNRMQNRQLAELGRFYDRSQAAREKLKTDLDAAYGEGERELRREIAGLESKLENAGTIRRAWRKLSGRLASMRQEIDGKRRSLANIEWRKQERTDALNQRLEQEREAIVTRHQQMRQLAPEQEGPEIRPERPAATQRRARVVQEPVRSNAPANQNQSAVLSQDVAQEGRRPRSPAPAHRPPTAHESARNVDEGPTRGRD